MSKYAKAVAAMSARRIEIADQTLTITAGELRKLAKGRAHIDKASGVMGIVRDGEILPRAGESVQRATVTISAPRDDAEQAVMVRAIVDHLSRNASIGGSQYDPAFAAEWQTYRALMAELRAS